MRTRYVVGSLLAAALLSSTALAQTAAPPRAPAPAATTATDVSPKAGQWRASKVIGVNIYNEQNEKLGDISEIILEPSGKVSGYVIGVGGFLGMGQHDILVEPGKIKFVNEPIRATTTSSNPPAGRTSANNPPAAGAPSANPPAAGAPTVSRNASNTSAAKDWYPDHGVLSATKDQLKAMQAFKY